MRRPLPMRDGLVVALALVVSFASMRVGVSYSPLDEPTGDVTHVGFRLSTFGSSLGGSIYF